MRGYLESLGYHVSGPVEDISVYKHGDLILRLTWIYDYTWTLPGYGGLHVTLDNIDNVLKMVKTVRDQK